MTYYGHKDFVLCLGYQADVIEQFFLHYEEWRKNDFTLSHGGKELTLEKSDIEEWDITFVDTRLQANIGERLIAVRRHGKGKEMFLANCSDGLTDLNLDCMIEQIRQSDRVGAFMAVRPSQSFHLVDLDAAGDVASLRSVTESNLLINSAFFALRRETLDYKEPGEELVLDQFARLIKERKPLGYRYDNFCCMDTFKEQQRLTDLHNCGHAPWDVWTPEVGFAASGAAKGGRPLRPADATVPPAR